MKKVQLNDVFWSLVNSYGTNVVSFFLVLVLARLISPTDFGIFAKISTVFVFLSVFAEGGSSIRLLNKHTLMDCEISEAITGILRRSIFIFFIILLSLAVFYLNSDLLVIYLLCSLMILTSPLQSIPVILLLREKRYKLKAGISIGTSLLGGIVSIIIATRGNGLYGLVYGQIFTSLTLTFFCIYYSKITRIFYGISFKNIINFNKIPSNFTILMSLLLEKSYHAIYYNLSAYFCGLEVTGYLSRAESVRMIASTTLAKAIGRVSNFYNVKEAARSSNDLKAHRMFQFFFCLCAVPSTALIVIYADFFVKMLFGVGWEGVGEILPFVIMNGFIVSLINLNIILFNSKQYFRISLLFHFLIIVSLISSFVLGGGDVVVILKFILFINTVNFMLSEIIIYFINSRSKT